MRVRGNWVSLLSWRAFSGNAGKMDSSIRRLSSGLRVNTAADDVAGMAVSQRIRGQYQGLVQATRNAMDGISLVQTAESALIEIHSLLQRAYEVSLQAANGTYGDEQKGLIQVEVDQVLREIDRITDTASYNNRKLLSANGSSAVANVINGLRGGWLEQAEKLIEQHYGLVGDNTNITVVLEQSGSQTAWVTGAPDPVTGKMDGIQLHINLQDFNAAGGPDGGTGPVYNDRKIARAVTTAVLGRNSDVSLVDSWFVSGVSDFLAGRDEQLAGDIATFGKQNIIDSMDDVFSGNWKEDSRHQSAAYVAVKFLNSLLSPFTLKDVMNELKSGNSLDIALLNTVGVNVQDFVNLYFKPNASAFMDTLNLTDADVGAIGGGNAADVIPNDGKWSAEPMTGFKITWPPLATSQQFSLQVGANESDTLTFSIMELSTYALDVLGVDVVDRAADAATRFAKAIGVVTGVRTSLGSVSNRLEHTINANKAASEFQMASMSRIVDLDFAKEMTNLSRQQILVQSSGAMLAQANAARQNVMWLLRGLSNGVAMGAG